MFDIAVASCGGHGNIARLPNPAMTLRPTLRRFIQQPWFSLSALGLLIVSISLLTAILAVVDGQLFKPLPYRDSQELFVLRPSASAVPARELQPADWLEVQTWARANPDIPWTAVSARLTEYPLDGVVYRLARIDARFLRLLDIEPLMGGFDAADFDLDDATVATDAPQPVLISHKLWLHNFGGDPTVVGRLITISQREGRTFAIRIAGVLDPGFLYPVDSGNGQPDLLTPLTTGQREAPTRALFLLLRVPKSADSAIVLTRLASATADIAKIKASASPHTSHGEQRARTPYDGAHLEPIDSYFGSGTRSAFWKTLAAGCLLLLAACFNIAALVMARNLQRLRELRIRRALGARLSHLAMDSGVELFLLVAVATCVAWPLAHVIVVWAVPLLPSAVTLAKEPALDMRVFGFVAILGLTTMLGIASCALTMIVRDKELSSHGFSSGDQVTPTRHARQGAALLMSIQVGSAFVLVVAGVLSMGSLVAAGQNELGYPVERMILVEAHVRRYVSVSDAQIQLQAARQFLSRDPRVALSAASSINSTFMRSFDGASTIVPEGWKPPLMGVNVRNVTQSFFDVMNIRLERGRHPTPGEWNDMSPVAIVSSSAARAFWPDADPIGRRLVSSAGNKRQKVWEVIGVMSDARFEGLHRDPTKEIYIPGAISLGRVGLLFHIRTNEAADNVMPGLLTDLSAQGLRVDRAATHEAGIFESTKHLIFAATLWGFLGTGALIVVAIGIWSLVAIDSQRRVREVGVRMALGADRIRIIQMMIREQLSPVIQGLIGGAVASAWLVSFLRSQLYGLGAFEPVLWCVAAITIVGIASVAAALPALRAARQNPSETLRAL